MRKKPDGLVHLPGGYVLGVEIIDAADPKNWPLVKYDPELWAMEQERRQRLREEA